MRLESRTFPAVWCVPDWTLFDSGDFYKFISLYKALGQERGGFRLDADLHARLGCRGRKPCDARLQTPNLTLSTRGGSLSLFDSVTEATHHQETSAAVEVLTATSRSDIIGTKPRLIES